MAQRGRSVSRPTTRPAPPRIPAVDAAAVRAVVQPAIEEAGYELEDLSVKPVGRRHLVKVIIDGDGGLGLDVIADVSRSISKALDSAEETGKNLLPGEYQLEVSSPGVDRPLTTPAHWRRNVGRAVKVKAGEKTLTGRVTAANDQGVTLDVAGIAHRLGYDGLGPGRVQIEFSRLEEISDDELAEFEDEEDER